MQSPRNWAEDCARRLRHITKREIRIRQHPGTRPPERTLEDDLRGAWACCIWSSGCGVRALIEGIPVFYEAPYWICSGAALRKIELIEKPLMDYRQLALHRMAYAQFTIAEISSGLPFELLRKI